MNRIIIIDDDAFICNVLEKHLTDQGYEVDTAYSASSGKKLLKEKSYSLALCDYRLPGSDGLKMFRAIKRMQPDAEVVIITAYADVRIAVNLIKEGVADYIVKPIRQEELLNLVKSILGRSDQKEEKKKEDAPGDFFFAKSKLFKDVLTLAGKVAPTNMSVLIEGPTGAGKEFLAKYIHSRSKRKNKPFVALDCGAVPRTLANSELFGHRKGAFTGALADKTGVFQEADGGTLFLDEVGNMDYEVQVKLLRTLQERTITRVGDANPVQVDVRIIAASNEPLKKLLEKGDFREDLYHRLNEFQLEIPGLRERGNDILDYTDFFIKQSNEQLGKQVKGIDDQVKNIFMQYSWEGNLRELRNVLKRAVLLSSGEFLTADLLPDEIRHFHLYEQADTEKYPGNSELKEISLEAERDLILNALREAGNNKSRAARQLGIDRKTLYNKLKKLNIDLSSGE